MSRGDDHRQDSREGQAAAAGDGRNIDLSVGTLEGEASGQRVPPRRAGTEGSEPFDVWSRLPSEDGRFREDPTYYDRPVIKKPVWIWAVPAYFYVGGVAGASAVLGAVAQVLDRAGLDGLIRRCRWITAAGGALGTFLLIVDLGRPGRFLNMLRVFRPTSPLSVGSWVLAAEAPLATASAALSRANGAVRALGDAAGLGAGVVGLPMSGYTAVLVSNTAVPVWQGARRALPPLFVGSAVSGAAALLELTGLEDHEHRTVHRFSVAGKVAELLSAFAVEREAGRVERVAEPLRHGASGAAWRVAKLLSAGSLALSLWPRPSRGKTVAAALLASGAAFAFKWAMFRAGQASAEDPRATFHQQRAGLEAVEATGAAAVVGPGDRRAAP